MSDEHFTDDGTLIEAWASHKSFQPKDGPPDGDGRNFHGQTRTNDTHASKTDPDARLYRKSFQSEARLAVKSGPSAPGAQSRVRWRKHVACRPNASSFDIAASLLL